MRTRIQASAEQLKLKLKYQRESVPSWGGIPCLRDDLRVRGAAENLQSRKRTKRS